MLNLENLAFPKEKEGFHISAFSIPDSVLDVESIHYDAQNALKTLPERYLKNQEKQVAAKVALGSIWDPKWIPKWRPRCSQVRGKIDL